MPSRLALRLAIGAAIKAVRVVARLSGRSAFDVLASLDYAMHPEARAAIDKRGRGANDLPS